MGLGGGKDIERLFERLHDLVIGLRTNDFSLIQDMVDITNERGITLYILDLDERSEHQFDCIMIEKGKKISKDRLKTRHISITMSEALPTLERAIAVCLDRQEPKNLVIGIDPGKRPGLASVADGRLLSIHRTVSNDKTIEWIMMIRSAYDPGNILVKVGNGAPQSRDIIIKLLKERKIPIELVDESRTSTERRFRDEAAAVIIAQTKGERL